jgi:hypothetical protein
MKIKIEEIMGDQRFFGSKICHLQSEPIFFFFAHFFLIKANAMVGLVTKKHKLSIKTNDIIFI